MTTRTGWQHTRQKASTTRRISCGLDTFQSADLNKQRRRIEEIDSGHGDGNVSFRWTILCIRGEQKKGIVNGNTCKQAQRREYGVCFVLPLLLPCSKTDPNNRY